VRATRKKPPIIATRANTIRPPASEPGTGSCRAVVVGAELVGAPPLVVVAPPSGTVVAVVVVAAVVVVVLPPAMVVVAPGSGLG
jgi:hypothetical protein